LIAEAESKSSQAGIPALASLPLSGRNPGFALRLAIALLGAAIIVGASLRFAGIGAREMSADEGASWAAAASPTLSEVVHLQAVLNPGKLAVYELLLHGWIRIFGDGLAAMRSLSALLDTLSIVAVFVLTREILAKPPPAAPDHSSAEDGLTADIAEIAAGLASLLIAVNLVTIKYARELRMYPLALLVVLLQVWVFWRAIRKSSGATLLPLAILTALALAIHFTAAFMIAAEAAWLLIWPPISSIRVNQRTVLPQIRIIQTLAAGFVVFFVIAIPALRTGASALAHGATVWIERPRVWAPLSMFNKGLGTFSFPVMAALAGWGAWRGWIRARVAASFALAWMWLPPLMLLIASYTFAPMFVERYALWCFVPFFMLAAIGTLELGGPAMSAIAIGLAVALALGHVESYRHRPHGVQWREAANATIRMAVPGMKIAVAPPYAANVVRYYLRGTRFQPAIEPLDDSGADILVAGDNWNGGAKAAKLMARYSGPPLALRGVRVYGRSSREP
jgi:mannosyltransferase